MMRITLICTDEDTWALGMRSISSVLKKAGHHTRLIFAGSASNSVNGKTMESIKSLSEQSELIGISSMSRSSGKAKEIIEALKPLHKPVVWGGLHPTLFPEDCAGHVDLVCRGEGEDFMIELLERLKLGEGYRDIRNGGYRENGRLILNEVRPLIPELDRLPMLDFSFEDEFRVNKEGEMRVFTSTERTSHILFSGSRGCVWNCHYCSNSQLKKLYSGKGRYARKMSVSRFVESTRACREIFPNAKYFYFTDEDFFARPLSEIKEFAEIYPKKVGLPFECMASPQYVTEEKMALLVEAGLWRIDIGVESGSDRLKKEIYNRNASNEIVMKSARIINRHPQVVTYYFFIIGNPYEDRDDLLGTIGLLRRLPAPFFLRTYNLVFMPGTHLYDRACQDGIIGGLGDSGYEIDFLAGFDYRKQAWKRNNLYLNGLISLMTGKSTRSRIGFIARSLFPVLLAPRMVDFHDRYQGMSKLMIALSRGGLLMRRMGLVLVSKILKDPGAVHNLMGKKRKVTPVKLGTERVKAV